MTIEPQQMTAGTVYNYTAYYDGNGNVTSCSDSIDNNSGSIMGSWSFHYDAFNRLQSGQATAGAWAGQSLCWSYDPWGNRTAQDLQTAACPAASSGQAPAPTASYNVNNQVTWVQNVAPAGYGYDAAGNLVNDVMNQYLYDGGGHLHPTGEDLSAGALGSAR